LDDNDKAASTRDLDVSSRGTDTTLSDTEVPLDTTDAFDDATDGQQGANPWVTAALIGLAVVALALILWFVLRRRRRLAEELLETEMKD
jgi:LPXTG-motif cell wall-anchored protein